MNPLDAEFENLVKSGAFKMPTDRLLKSPEVKLLKAHGIDSIWVKCPLCGTLGGSTDRKREYCGTQCEALHVQKTTTADSSTPYAGVGDEVNYMGQRMKILATNYSPERQKKDYHKTYSYILFHNGYKIEVKDLEEALCRM